MAQVILLPGVVLPAELAYGALIDELGEDVEAVAKELELYARGEPPEDYSLDVEIAGVLREADARGWDRFHVVGYSAGGASMLATVARHGDRVLSLALLEPAWAGSFDLSPVERRFWDESALAADLPAAEFMADFVRHALRPGVVPPAPIHPPPPWMATRPAGIRAIQRAFAAFDLDADALRLFERPVYFALGALSNPDHYAEIANRLSRVLQDFTLEVFEDRHHFDPPHRAEPERLANSLRALWERAEGSD